MDEKESLGQEQMNEILFMQIVGMFQASALQNMGKVMNPATQKTERDLAQSKGAIDILGMLQAKTEGNLSQGEQQMLERTLFELRMNYVDEINKEKVEKGKNEKLEPEVPEKDEPEDKGEAS